MVTSLRHANTVHTRPVDKSQKVPDTNQKPRFGSIENLTNMAGEFISGGNKKKVREKKQKIVTGWRKYVHAIAWRAVAVVALTGALTQIDFVVEDGRCLKNRIVAYFKGDTLKKFLAQNPQESADSEDGQTANSPIKIEHLLQALQKQLPQRQTRVPIPDVDAAHEQTHREDQQQESETTQPTVNTPDHSGNSQTNEQTDLPAYIGPGIPEPQRPTEGLDTEVKPMVPAVTDPHETEVQQTQASTQTPTQTPTQIPTQIPTQNLLSGYTEAEIIAAFK